MFGYDAGAKAAFYAANHDTSIREAAVALGIMSPEAVERLLDPVILTDAQRSPALVDAMLADERGRVAAVIAGLGPAVRQAIFDVARAVARADGEVSSQERQVLEVVASALQIDADASATELDGLGLDVDGLGEADRRLIYACGAWLASSDGVVEDSEVAILDSLREQLELDEDGAAGVQAEVAKLRGDRREYMPRAEALPWWEDFAQLLSRVLVETAAT